MNIHECKQKPGTFCDRCGQRLKEVCPECGELEPIGRSFCKTKFMREWTLFRNSHAAHLRYRKIFRRLIFALLFILAGVIFTVCLCSIYGPDKICWDYFPPAFSLLFIALMIFTNIYEKRTKAVITSDFYAAYPEYEPGKQA